MIYKNNKQTYAYTEMTVLRFFKWLFGNFSRNGSTYWVQRFIAIKT